MKLVPRLKEKYIKEIVPTLCKNLSFSNKMQAPKLVKIVLNMGLGLDGTDNKILKSAEDDLSAIAGQKAQIQAYSAEAGRRSAGGCRWRWH